MALPVFLVTASRSERPPWVRGLAASATVLLLLTFFFTFSRGGYVALAVALLVYFALSARRLSAFVSLALPVAFTAAVLLRVRGLDTLFATTTDDRLRAAQGHELAAWCAAALVLAGAAQVAVALAERRWTLSPRQARVIGTVVVAVVVVTPLALGTASVVQHGGVGWVSDQYHAALTETELHEQRAAAHLAGHQRPHPVVPRGHSRLHPPPARRHRRRHLRSSRTSSTGPPRSRRSTVTASG